MEPTKKSRKKKFESPIENVNVKPANMYEITKFYFVTSGLSHSKCY